MNMEQDRNIDKYSQDYINNYGFESILVKYRRNKVLETLNNYKSKRILEIGCGVDSISNYYVNFDKWVIVEPSKKFLKTAVKDKHNSNIEIYSDFFENIIDVLSNKNFDFVILSALLHEVPNTTSFLQKIVGG